MSQYQRLEPAANGHKTTESEHALAVVFLGENKCFAFAFLNAGTSQPLKSRG